MAANVSFALSTPFFAMSQTENHSDSIELPVVDPGPDALEREIASKASKGPRVTIEDIEENIVSEHYFSAADGARFGWLTADHADAGVRERVRALVDRSAWLLIVMGALILGATDYRLLMTLVQWTAFALVLAGVSIVVSRVVFPSVNLGELIERMRSGELPAAVVAAALLVFVGMLFNGIVQWAAK